jgi:hypothetical protein
MKDVVRDVVRDVVKNVSGISKRLSSAVAPVIPELVSAEIAGKYIDITFDSEIDQSSIPDISAFEVIVNSVIVSMAITESYSFGISLEKGTGFAFGDIVTLSYTQPALNPLQGLDGGLVASFTDYPVTNNIEAP